MRKYTVYVEEILNKAVEVVAESDDEAMEIVQKAYDRNEIVLSSDNYCGPTEFYINDASGEECDPSLGKGLL